jgi:hypothetical protein
MRRGSVLAMAALLPAGCAGPGQTTRCPPPAQAAPIVELFFGRGLPEGGEVGEGQWRRFLDEVVTPRFPDGLTVIDAAGQWRGRDGIEQERSKILLIVAVDARDLDARLDAVIAAYKLRFHQQSVLRVDGSTCVVFR